MKVLLAARNSRFDLAALEPYGEIQYFASSLNPFNTENCMQVFKDGLGSDFDPTEDYICTTGNLLLVSMLMMIAYSEFDTFKILIFDATSSNYRERIICHV